MNRKLKDIINLKFSDYLDDTIVNRFSETLFCKNECHDGKRSEIQNVDVCSLDEIISTIKLNLLYHPNIIKAVLGLLYIKSPIHSYIIPIIKTCLKSKYEEICYSGLWCCKKMINELEFNDELLHLIVEKYEFSQNFIFLNLLNELVTEIILNNYLSDVNVKEIIFKGPIKTDLLLMLVNNDNFWWYNNDALLMEMKNVSFRLYLSSPILLYCISCMLCKNYDNCVILLIEELRSLTEYEEKKILKCYLNCIRNKVLSGVMHDFLWKRCWEIAINGDKSFIRCISLIRNIKSNILPSGALQKILHNNLMALLSNVTFVENDIEIILLFLLNDNNNDCQVLLERTELYYAAYRSIFSVAGEKFMESGNNLVKEFYTKSLHLIKNSIEMEDVLNLYKFMIESCIWSSVLCERTKWELVENDIPFLLQLQLDLVNTYLNSGDLDLLDTKPTELLVHLIRLSLSIHCTTEPPTLSVAIPFTVFVETMFVMLNKIDFIDKVLFESNFYVALYLCLASTNQIVDLVDLMPHFCRRLLDMEINFNLPLVLQIVSRLHNKTYLLNILKESIFKFCYRPITEEDKLVIIKMDSIGIEIPLLTDLQFCTSFCPDCCENLEELASDLLLAANPLECFGD